MSTGQDRPPTPPFRGGNAALRTEALRQLRWQQREWERVLAAHPTGTPCLVAVSQRAGLTDGLDLLQEAGEDVPSWLSRRGARVVARGATTRVKLRVLLADITQALAWFDPEPNAHDEASSAGRLLPGADGDRGLHGALAEMSQAARPDNIPVVFTFRPGNPQGGSWEDFMDAVERGCFQYGDGYRRMSMAVQTGHDPEPDEMDPAGAGP